MLLHPLDHVPYLHSSLQNHLLDWTQSLLSALILSLQTVRMLLQASHRNRLLLGLLRCPTLEVEGLALDVQRYASLRSSCPASEDYRHLDLSHRRRILANRAGVS